MKKTRNEAMQEKLTDSTRLQIKQWQTKMFWMMWITYASFYLCRVNISVALPGIMQEFGLTKTNLGIVLSSLFAMYAIGQFINGQLGDKLNSRKIITIGLIASAIMNFLFGFTGGLIGFMVVLWGINGYVQSMGWGPTVKAMANWFPHNVRGRISGRLGTSYIIGGALSWLLAGTIIKYYGWRFTFWVPSIICIFIAIHWFLRAKNAPEEIGLPSVEDQENGIENKKVRKDEHIGFRETLKVTLLNPHIWYAALGLFGLNIVRYGFMSWAPTYMFEEQGASISVAAYKAVACLIILLFIGFFTFGPHILIVAALPADFGSRKAASSVTGFIDAMGYVGASLTGVGTGFLVDNFSWDAAFYFWIFGAIMAAVMMVFVWKFELKKG
jgi:sugar phosphate permease